MTIAPIAQDDIFARPQGVSSTIITGNLGADNGHGVDFDPDGSVLGWVAGVVTSLIGDGQSFLSAFFTDGVLQFLTIQGTVSYPHPVIVTATAIATAQGGWVTLDTSGNFHYQSPLGFSGIDTFSYTLVDENFNFTTATVSLTVTPTPGANNRPVAADDAFLVPEDLMISGNLLIDNGSGPDTDPDGDALHVLNHTIYSANGGLVRLQADGSFTYTPRAGFSGTDGFDYTLLDVAGARDTGHVTLTVLPVNDAPGARDDVFSLVHDRVLAGNLLANNGQGADSDQDGDQLAVTPAVVVTAAGGVVTINADGTFSYQPAAGFVGPDSFDYTVSDPSGLSDQGHVTLNVTNRAPVAGLDSYTLGYRATKTGNLLTNDSDPDGDAIGAVAGRLVSARGSVLTLAADGSFTFKAGDLATGVETFTYVVRDALGAGSTGTAQFLIGHHGGYSGTQSDDSWTGGDGNDVAFLGAGDDWGVGAGGADILGGGAGDDTLFGGLGGDKLYGEADRDELYGGAGADTLYGGAGNDRLKGGAGADRFMLDIDPADTDRIGDFAATDRLVFTAPDLGLAAGALPGADYLAAYGAADSSHARFLYQAASKTLFWDHDGLASTAAQVVVQFETKVTLTADHFLLV